MYNFGLLIIIMTYGSKTYSYKMVKLYYGLTIFTDHTTKVQNTLLYWCTVYTTTYRHITIEKIVNHIITIILY